MKRPVALLAILLVAGCSNAAAPSPTAIASPSAALAATPTLLPVLTATPSPIPSPLVLTNFGATQSAFVAHHQLDTTSGAASGYDHNDISGLDTYQNVAFTNGTVTAFTFNWAPTGLDVAEANIRSNLGADATQVWKVQKDACLEEEWTSPELAAALKPLGDPQGWVYVELDHADPATGAGSLDLNAINEEIYGLGSYPTSANTPPC